MITSKYSAILLLAGTGTRFEEDLPKQFHLLQSKKVYLWTLDTFAESQLFHEIILVIPKKWIQEVTKDLENLPYDIPIKTIPGGASRQESSYLGVGATSKNTTHVCIHEYMLTHPPHLHTGDRKEGHWSRSFLTFSTDSLFVFGKQPGTAHLIEGDNELRQTVSTPNPVCTSSACTSTVTTPSLSATPCPSDDA